MKYPFSVYYTQVEDHCFWIAECSALKGCTGQGDTPEEALEELALNEEEWLKTAEEYGIPIPALPLTAATDYSGKLTVRIAPYVHKVAAKWAQEQGISLNQYINDAIVFQNAAMTTADAAVPAVQAALKKLQFLHETAITAKSSQNYSTANPYTIPTGPLHLASYKERKEILS